MTDYLTLSDLQRLVDFNRSHERVTNVLNSTRNDPERLVRFLDRYATWNCRFAAGVALLVANIGDQVGLFTEQGQPRALADRSCYVASFIFDAARDEFNDHITRHRDPHRSLAQAMLLGFAEHSDAVHVLNEPVAPWVQTLSESVLWRYSGGNAQGADVKVFTGMGFHLGSEVLADAEFSLIDDHLRTHENELVQKVLRTKKQIADYEHRCYAWIGVHSGHDGAAEADHFAWGLQGVNKALGWAPAEKREHYLSALKVGFCYFADMHAMFFDLAAKDEHELA